MNYRFFIVTIAVLLVLYLPAKAFAQYKSPGPVGAKSTISECFTNQGVRAQNSNAMCSEHSAVIYSISDRNYINQPLRVGTDYPYGFNYSTRDVWSVCRETDGRSPLINGSYCKLIQGENINYWVPALGPMSVRWDADFKNETEAPVNIYFYKIYTSSLPTDTDWEGNRNRQSQICNKRGFGNVIGKPIKMRYDDILEQGYGAAPLMPTDPSIPNKIDRRSSRNQYHLILCDASAYLAHQQAIAKLF